MNVVILSGRVGTDPELRDVNGTALCKFRLATNEYNGETAWHSVVVWGKQAESCGEHLEKGQWASVCGSLVYRSWENKEGQKVNSTEINAQRVEFGPKRRGSESTPNTPPAQEEKDDLPF